jgi:hypothetical protein
MTNALLTRTEAQLFEALKKVSDHNLIGITIRGQLVPFDISNFRLMVRELKMHMQDTPVFLMEAIGVDAFNALTLVK